MSSSSRPRSILVHVDTEIDPRGHDGLARATRLALAADARLTLADVVPDVPAYVRRLLPGGPHLVQLLREERAGRLDLLARRARRAGVATDVLTLEGSAVVAIVREVVRGGHDLLVVRQGRDAGDATSALGLHLVRKAPCPVWLLPPPRADGAAARRPRRPRVLAAIDVAAADEPPTPEHRASAALAAQVLEAAAALAELQQGELHALHALHAWTAYGETPLQRRAIGGVSRADVAQYVARVEAVAREALRAAVAPLGARLRPECVHLVKGYADEVVPAFAEARGVDTVVIGTVARSGVAGLLVGNTAERVLETACGAVLVVKPDGFVSPVRAAPGEVAGAARAARTVAGPAA
jgi:nucleotide-binding universal stress UspA family protein